MKNILVVTGTRAEYGILKGLLEKFKESPDVNLKIIATAMHLEERYGNTYHNIESDGFEIDLKIPMNLSDTSDLTILRGMSILQVKLAEYLSKNNFDLVIILGDRYEMLAVANCAVIMKIPICHLHGGEITLGNYDEFIRHSITKMSHLHLASTAEYRRRILQLGESEDRVLNVGALGVENVVNNLKDMEIEDLNFLNLKQKYGVVLFHPETLKAGSSSEEQINILLSAIEKQRMQFIFIGSNSDSGSDTIMEKIYDYVQNDPFDSKVVASFDTHSYHTLVHNSQFLIGNSSSGIIEVPSLKVPTINLGSRQEGRIRGESVIDVPVEISYIDNAIQQAMSLDFQKKIVESKNPYYQENAIQQSFDFIMKQLNKNIPIEKEFVDRSFI
ncbi:UDP-N-acetylglucosamine 2-epimerase [Lactococcus formosensis]|uniref:UDP-N-acetylglucosamine 2-epimerase n=1 Tax=Lactococcus formosensis TaxID=1281486 RepID=UPI002435B432|nr:UDP-N-acetylglucosamine 2-epimerase [Lactococcus formosensis]MDG6187900.1 UDP-N-acetylglucosamine 2-epimerase [Lactococcus formosensis]